MEYQIMDRLSFMRFLGLDLDSRVPDAKTIWLFRSKLEEHKLSRKLFDKFNAFLAKSGFVARKGQIVDATIEGIDRGSLKKKHHLDDSTAKDLSMQIITARKEKSIIREQHRFLLFNGRYLFSSDGELLLDAASGS